MRRCTACQIDYPDAIDVCPRDGERLPPAPIKTRALYDPLIGSTIDGRYIIETVLGEGGMGVVYAARHAIIDKRVAIKVLRKEAAADESAAQRFLAEAKAASKIDQQNIVDITDFGVLPDGHAYFVMEFLDGVTLSKMVHSGGPLAPAAAVSIAVQVARGLSAAHAKGIVHRDLKPDNVFVMERDGISDFVKIVDFGIARDASSKKRLTVAGMVMGTPEYMAPEQASGQETDHRVDQYSLGCILYESLTGMVPFTGENAMQTLTKHVFEPVTPPSMRRPDLTIPPPLEAVVLRTLEKKREDRYADMDDLMRVLQELQPSLLGIAVPLNARPITAEREEAGGETISETTGLEVPTQRRGRMFALLGGAAVVAGVFAVSAWSSRPKPPPELVANSTQPSVPIAPQPAPPTEPPKAAERVSIKLTSTPSGAEVFLDAERIGLTPTATSQPKGAATLHFTFRHEGFDDAAREVPATNDAYVDVTMAKAEPAQATRTASIAKVGRPAPPAPIDKSAGKSSKPDKIDTAKVDPARALPSPTPIAISPKPAPTESQSALSKSKRLNDLRNPFETSTAIPK